MNQLLFIYLVCWISACMIAFFIFFKDRNTYPFFYRDYWLFLSKPWKVITFLMAASGMTAIAPYSGDPTWDYFDAIFMSCLTFITAPWAIGTLYKFAKKELPLKQAFVAVCFWIFSASWSYDLYLLTRDGAYPMTWSSNIPASSVLYISAGLLWNLDWRKEKGVIFAFMEKNWPSPSSLTIFPKIFGYASTFMVLVTFLIMYFFRFQVY
jgi:hypothetical protein